MKFQNKNQESKTKNLKPNLEWTALEFESYPKNRTWLLVSGTIAVSLSLWAIFNKNFLFLLLIGLAYFSLAVFAFKQPRQIRFAITPSGIMIDKTLYLFKDLKSFWIFEQGPQIKELSLVSRKTLMPYIKVPLGQQNPAVVRQKLIKYLPEKRQEESLIDNLARYFRY